MEIANVTKAATFKKTQFLTVFYNYFHETNIN